MCALSSERMGAYKKNREKMGFMKMGVHKNPKILVGVHEWVNGSMNVYGDRWVSTKIHEKRPLAGSGPDGLNALFYF